MASALRAGVHVDLLIGVQYPLCLGFTALEIQFLVGVIVGVLSCCSTTDFSGVIHVFMMRFPYTGLDYGVSHRWHGAPDATVATGIPVQSVAHTESLFLHDISSLFNFLNFLLDEIRVEIRL